MRQVVPGTCTVAWFKLAEFVSRGEKERALGLYRLLLHSFDDYAVGCQLAGDILSAFNDAEAIEKYKEAGELYKKSGRVREAISIYEQLSLSCSQNKEFLFQLLELYSLTGDSKKVVHTLDRCIPLLLSTNDHDNVRELLRAHQSIIMSDARWCNQIMSVLRTVHHQCDACSRLTNELL